MRRRDFLACAAATLGGPAIVGAAPRFTLSEHEDAPLFKISLAQWSLHRAFFADELDPLAFAETARTRYDLDAVEYVNVFFQDKASDRAYLGELKQRAEDHGVKSLLIMVDREGALGDSDPAERAKAVQNHHKWVEAAAFLGCHSIRVNARSHGAPDAQREAVVDGLRTLTEFAAPHAINVIVENHGEMSSDGGWLADVMRRVDHPRCGTLPDFGNFMIKRAEDAEDGKPVWYDRYRGVTELMPFAKAVSAKSHEFDAEGNETTTDYRRMMRIVLDAGYHGYVGIEYEGSGLGEHEGILATKKLLERVRAELGES